MSPPAFRIEPARTAVDFAAVAVLFRDYAETLDVDLSFQDFDREVATLPGGYAAPAGSVLIARDAADVPLGCVALRPFDPPDVCEMKRLYLVPEARGLGVGRALVAAVVEAARGLGYRTMHLDTLSTMHAAVGLYERAGFARVPAYYRTPIEGTLFFSRVL